MCVYTLSFRPEEYIVVYNIPEDEISLISYDSNLEGAIIEGIMGVTYNKTLVDIYHMELLLRKDDRFIILEIGENNG